MSYHYARSISDTRLVWRAVRRHPATLQGCVYGRGRAAASPRRLHQAYKAICRCRRVRCSGKADRMALTMPQSTAGERRRGVGRPLGARGAAADRSRCRAEELAALAPSARLAPRIRPVRHMRVLETCAPRSLRARQRRPTSAAGRRAQRKPWRARGWRRWAAGGRTSAAAMRRSPSLSPMPRCVLAAAESSRMTRGAVHRARLGGRGRSERHDGADGHAVRGGRGIAPARNLAAPALVAAMRCQRLLELIVDARSATRTRRRSRAVLVHRPRGDYWSRSGCTTLHHRRGARTCYSREMHKIGLRQARCVSPARKKKAGDDAGCAGGAADALWWGFGASWSTQSSIEEPRTIRVATVAIVQTRKGGATMCSRAKSGAARSNEAGRG